MSDLKTNLEEMARLREECDKKCQDLFCEALSDATFLKDNWPPSDKIKLIDGKDLQKNTYHIQETEMPWYIPENIPEDKLINAEATAMTFVDINYAAEKGYMTHRIMTRRMAADINKLTGDNESKAINFLRDALIYLKEEVNKEKAIEYVTDISIYAHLEGCMVSLFMACLVAFRPSEEKINQIRMSELQGRLVTLLKALPPTKEGGGPNPKDWEWEFTRQDAELALKIIEATNPEAPKLTMEQFQNMSFMGVSIKSTDAEKTQISIKFFKV